jgi:hypothetical protein
MSLSVLLRAAGFEKSHRLAFQLLPVAVFELTAGRSRSAGASSRGWFCGLGQGHRGSPVSQVACLRESWNWAQHQRH